MEDHFEHVYNREYITIEDLVNAAIAYDIIRKEDRENIVIYIQRVYKDGYYYQPTDIKIEGDDDLTIRVPLTLQALKGILQQKEKERQYIMKQIKINCNITEPQQITMPENILNELEKEKLITKEPLQWVGAKNLCAYFVNDYFKTITNKWETGKKLFGVENLAQLKDLYENNKNGKPKNYKIIDCILQACK